MKTAILKITSEAIGREKYIDIIIDELVKQSNKVYVLYPERCDAIGIVDDRKKVSYVLYNEGNKHFTLSLIDKGSLTESEEIILVEDIVFGPVFSLKKTIAAMREKKVDFWALYENPNRHSEKDGGFISEGIYPGFIYLNRSAIISNAWKTYISLCDYRRRDEFTDLLATLKQSGLHYCTVADTKSYMSNSIFDNVEMGEYYCFEMLKKYEIPFVPWNAIKNTYFLMGGDEAPARVFEFVKNRTKYDTDAVWKHLLATQDCLDILKELHCERIISNSIVYNRVADTTLSKAVIVAHLYYEDLLDVCMEYLKMVPNQIRVVVATANKSLVPKVLDIIKNENLINFELIEKNNRGRDFSALLVAAKDIVKKYEYVCFVHDKKSHSVQQHTPSGKTWMYMMWESMLSSKEYVTNILDLLERDESLGLVAPPAPFQSSVMNGLGQNWAGDFEVTKQLGDRIGLDFQLSRDKQPMALSTAFWCKRAMIDPLLDYGWRYDDFPDEPMAIDGTICHALERAPQYIAQALGYYTLYVMTEEIGTLRASRLNEYSAIAMNLLLDVEMLSGIDGGGVIRSDRNLNELKYQEQISSIVKYVNNHNKSVYVYGAGKYGKMCVNLLRSMGAACKGIVVSKLGEEKSLDGIDIIDYECFLSTRDENAGLLIALKRSFCDEVIPRLIENGIEDMKVYWPIP